MDKLSKIVEKQQELHSHVGFCSEEQLNDMSGHETRLWVARQLAAAAGEIDEVYKELGWVKWWKNNPDKEFLKGNDWKLVREELVDVFFFVVGSMITAGMSAEDIYNGYCEKWNKNLNRKDWDVNK